MKRVLQFNCSGCAFVCAKKWKCWRPKCFLYPQNRKQYKLPWPVLPRWPRPASPCRALALCSLGPIPWTLSLQPSSLSELSRNTIFGMKDLSWVPECLSLKGVCSPHRLGAFGKTIVSFAVVLKVMTFPQDGSAHLHVARVLLVQRLFLLPTALSTLWSSPWIPVWCQGGKCPAPLCLSLLSSTLCPTATRSILNRCCLQHLGLAVRGWEMLT